MESFDDGIKHEFLIEAAEMLEEVESKFLDLERDPKDKGTMDHIFRLAHTVKGSSFAAGFMPLGAFAHTFETLLNLLREDKVEATPHVVDILLQSNDTLQKFIAALNDDFDADIDVTHISGLLTECIGDNVKAKWDGPAFGFFDDDEPAAPAPATAAAPAPTASPKTATPAQAKPAAPQNATAAPANRSQVQLSSAIQPTVLVCDDEEDILEIIVDLIQSAHPKLTIVTASDGREAVEQVKKHKPHLIVTDLRMPNLNGLEFVAEVRKHDENVPVIFVSGFADRENIIAFVKLGVSDFLDKPIDSGRLSLSVANGIKQSQTREGIVRLSSLNFKAYMTTLKLSQIGANQKSEFDEISLKVKNLLDEIAVLSNYILGL